MKTITLIVPVYNESEVIDIFLGEINNVTKEMLYSFEILFIDDGSQDKTAEIIINAAKKDSRIRLVSLSRNFGKDAALTCGLDYSRGDAVIPIDVDLQDPPETIAALISEWENGAHVVNAIRSDRRSDGWLKRKSAELFYSIMIRSLGVRMTPNAGDFRLIDRRVVEVIKTMREKNRFMKGLLSWPGFKTSNVFFTRPPRAAGATKWNYWKLWNFALNGIIGYSTGPLKIWLYVGTLLSLMSFTYAVIIVIQKIIWGNPVAGYPSLMCAILFMGGVQLISLGIIGEYLARVFEETKGRPLYVVMADSTSI